MSPIRSDREQDPPAFLQLAGHPLRWRLLRELGRSDRRVHELTELVDEPQNLVSYHLAKLRDADLVTARRSSADGRDAYYTIDLGRVGDALSAAGRALHPALGPGSRSSPDDRTGSATKMARVLFLCTGNSARSQMAEALVSSRSAGLVEARSAGSRPKPLHPNAVRVMRDEYGIDIAGWEPKHLDDFADARFDRVITLCDRVREICPEFPGRPVAAHWSMPDPAAGHDDDTASYPAFRQIAAELETRIGFLLAGIAERADGG
jgi:ArsR family transcriptional regulator, arsenate/arsenite/antimonite-responsive transcriptional repressor / arsenate reductase (thioredoxin)